MKLQQIPNHDRPREKLLRLGEEALSDEELLAIFLRTGIRSTNAVELAGQLLADSSLRDLLDAPIEHICKKPGIGMTKAITLKAILALSRRYLSVSLKRGGKMSGPSDVKDYLMMQLRDHQSEVFACMFLDAQGRLIKFAKMFYGSIDRTHVYPREIVRAAIEANASGVILAHNHPSGSSSPSSADKMLTELLQEALNIIDVRVLDHVVVGDTETSSFAELGLL